MSKKRTLETPAVESWPRWIPVDERETAYVREDGLFRYSVLEDYDDDGDLPLPSFWMLESKPCCESKAWRRMSRFINKATAMAFVERHTANELMAYQASADVSAAYFKSRDFRFKT